MLIVIAILAILAAVVIFGVVNLTTNAKKSACKTDFNTVSTAATAYFTQNNSGAAAMSNLVSGQYLSSAPSATLAANGYTITYTQVANSPGTVTVTTAGGPGTTAAQCDTIT